MSLSKSIKSKALSLIKKNPLVGSRILLLLKLFGADTLGVKVADNTGFIPNVIPVWIPAHSSFRKKFKLNTVSGRDSIARRLWFLGWHGFEKPLLDVFSACVEKSSGTVVDVGANTGLYSILAIRSSKYVNVHAFEPHLQINNCLKKNIFLNNFNNKIRVFNYAVSDEAGEAEMYIPVENSISIETSCSLNKEFKETHSSVIKVLVTTLDLHVKQYKLKEVSILKIDVESLEHKVLKGATNLIQEQRPIVFLELLPCGNAAILEEIRQSNRYIAIRLRPELAVIGKKVEYDDHTWLHILIPEEKLEWLLGIFKEIKLDFEEI